MIKRTFAACFAPIRACALGLGFLSLFLAPMRAQALSVSTTVVAGVNTIQGAVLAGGPSLSGNLYITINGGTYLEQVTVQNIATNGFQIFIASGTGGAPVINPPFGSTAAFVIANSSVNLIGINIISTNTITYGVLVSSSYVSVSSVTVQDSAGVIATAGIMASNWTTISYTSVTVGGTNASAFYLPGIQTTVSDSWAGANSSNGNGLYVAGSFNTITQSFMTNLAGEGAFLDTGADGNTISFSTLTSNASGYDALYLGAASSNTVTLCAIANANGYGAYLDANSDFNTIGQSTMTSDSSGDALYVDAPYNTITLSVMSNPGGYAAYLDAFADDVTISLSTMASHSSFYYALYLTGGASSDTVTQSYLTNPSGVTAWLDSGSSNNTISWSTITSHSSSSDALYLSNASSNTIAQCTITNLPGEGAGLVGGSQYNTISLSAISNNSASYNALYLVTAASNTITQCVISNPSGGGVDLDASSQYNTVGQSTISANASLNLYQASFNAITQDELLSSGGDAAYLYSNSNSNTFSLSAITSAFGNEALFIGDSSSNTFTQSSITDLEGSGADLDNNSNYNSFSQSVMTSSATGYDALYLGVAAYNSISLSTITNPADFAAFLDAGASSNTISQSVITSNNSAFFVGDGALYVDGTLNIFTGVNVSNASGYAAVFDAAFNSISSSTITSGAATWPVGCAAAFCVSDNANVVTQDFIVSPGGDGIDITGNGNVVSQSTITSAAASMVALDMYGNLNTISQDYVFNSNGYGVYFDVNSASNTLSQSYVEGQNPVVVMSSLGSAVYSNVLSVLAAGSGDGVYVGGPSENFTMSSNVVISPAVGYQAGVYLDSGNLGTISLTSTTISGSQYGLDFAAQDPAASLTFSSFTFKNLTPGATAIELLGPTFNAAIANANFVDSSIAINVDASALSAGSNVVMVSPSGAESGQPFDHDPNNYVQWSSAPAPTSSITSPSAPFIGSLPSIGGMAQAYGGATVSSVSVTIQDLATALYWNGASSFASASPVFNLTTLSTATASWAYVNGALTTSLTNGTSYQILSQATDSNAQVQTSGLTVNFTLDTTPPTIFISSPTSASSGTTFPDVVGTAGDPIIGVSQVGVQISSAPGFSTCWNGTTWGGCPDYLTAVGTTAWTLSGTLINSSVTPGTTYQILAKATDFVGNTQFALSSFTYTGVGNGCAISTYVAAGVNTIQGAVNAAGSSLTGNFCIIVASGNYNEQVTIQNIATNGYFITIASARPGIHPRDQSSGGLDGGVRLYRGLLGRGTGGHQHLADEPDHVRHRGFLVERRHLRFHHQRSERKDQFSGSRQLHERGGGQLDGRGGQRRRRGRLLPRRLERLGHRRLHPRLSRRLHQLRQRRGRRNERPRLGDERRPRPGRGRRRKRVDLLQHDLRRSHGRHRPGREQRSSGTISLISDTISRALRSDWGSPPKREPRL